MSAKGGKKSSEEGNSSFDDDELMALGNDTGKNKNPFVA